tara:strand:- start:5284 stop:7041 length:1758 start_codon:yes stop_codon:yes gene_type:complete
MSDVVTKRKLASTDLANITEVSKKLNGLDKHTLDKLPVQKLYIARNYTVEQLIAPLKVSCFERGVKLDISVGNYNTAFMDAYILPSDIENADYILVSLLSELIVRTDHQAELGQLDNSLQQLIQCYLAKTKAVLIINGLLLPSTTSVDLESGIARYVRSINNSLRRLCYKHYPRTVYQDPNLLVSRIGSNAAIDRRYKYLASSPFTPSYWAEYSRDIAPIICSTFCPPKKVLILDCDNTLWGGVIGEDGIEGILLSQSDYPGRAYYDFQKQVVALLDKGVLLCLASKNNQEDVLAVLDRHPSCLIKRQNIVAMQINWDDKATNIRKIAMELNLGLDSMVFIDDSPTEIALIEQELPEVETICANVPPYDLPSLIENSRSFDGFPLISDEDKVRTQLYESEKVRIKVAEKYTDLESFLAALDVSPNVFTPEEKHFGRLTQLTQKTNQFNLTTRRRNLGEIKAMAASPSYFVKALQVSDRYGDYGITGLFIAQLDESDVIIDTFLLSCRILGKDLEFYFIEKCIEDIYAQWSPGQLIATYTRTLKNDQVSSFWDKLGFTSVEQTEQTHLYSAEKAQLTIPSPRFLSK